MRNEPIFNSLRVLHFALESTRVYATPELVRDIEDTCRDMMLEHLDEGQDTVGTRVELDHTGASLLGMTVDITATIASFNGRMVTP